MPWPLIPVVIDEATTRNVLRHPLPPTERTMKYAAHGKQVQRGSEHVADAADETWAQIITDALNGERALYPYQREALRAMRIDPIRVSSYDYASEPSETIHMISYTGRGRPEHTWQRQQDEYACSCGVRWDVNDGDEHPPTR